MMSQIFIALDVETTGLNPQIHSVCQLGAVVFTREEILAEKAWDVYVERAKARLADPEALSINGFTEDRLIEGENARDVLYMLNSLFGMYHEPIAVFHNAPFDVDFIRGMGSFFKYGSVAKGLRRVLDTVSLAYASGYDEKLLSLEKIATMVLSPAKLENWKKHDALSDSRVTAMVTQVLLRTRKL